MISPAYLLGELLHLVVGRLLSWHMFDSDCSLSVKRAGPGGFELTAPMPWLELFIHYLLRETSGAVVWMVPLSRGGGESGIWRQRPLCSVVGHSSIFTAVLISVGRTGAALGVIAMCQVQISSIHPLVVKIGFMKTGARLVPGIMVKAITRRHLRSIAANWPGDREYRLILFGQITEQLLTWGAVVRCKWVFRIAILRGRMVSIVHHRGRGLR